jgi:transcriptional pleiotropic regulator of transition state genes
MIKATGLPRRIDHLGRIVVPVEMRRMLEISPGDELEISVQGDSITLSRMRKGCVFCGTDQNLRTFRDKEICPNCASEAKSSFNGFDQQHDEQNNHGHDQHHEPEHHEPEHHEQQHHEEHHHEEHHWQ